ncbi:hypothetical protein R5R35_002427 [Gryllus longicercus]|uniref:SAGA-associated factor 11 homolog n=1 Tax=Gryllus longicercus TaxID=2509291 RepID=A0AAN9Z1R8_9ORTH
MASVEEKQIELDREVRSYLSNPNNVEAAAEAVLNDLVDSVVLGIVFEVHRAAKCGIVDHEDGITDEVSKFEIVEGADMDIFGQPLKKRPQRCICPSCKRSLAALRFAPHLSKCMGLGRNSLRLASRQITNSSKEMVGYSATDDNDSELSLGSDRRRKKRVSFGTRRPKNSKTGRNGDVTLETGTCSELNNSNMNYDSMSNEEKKNLLMQICGVISVSTRKLCTRSMRCSQHSDEQRRAVRAALLNSQGSDMNSTPDMLQVDIDSYEDGDGQSMCESLGQSWEQEHSNTSSPADSASTSSSSSKKREKNTKTQE